MSRSKNNKSLKQQSAEKLDKMMKIGKPGTHIKQQRKQAARDAGMSVNDYNRPAIFGYSTLATYKRQCNYFVTWCKANYPASERRTIEQCRAYADDYLTYLIEDKGWSAYSISTAKAAIAKLYQEPTNNFRDTPSRHRSDIKRSRSTSEYSKHFSEKKHADDVSFWRSVGMRRCELLELRGTWLREADGQYYIDIPPGVAKGGKPRTVEVLNNNPIVVEKCQAAGKDKVFPKISSAANIHGYRSDYAAALYEKYARPVDELKGQKTIDKSVTKDKRNTTGTVSAVIHCRGDMAGKSYDRDAMLHVVQNLGHSRSDISTSNYSHKIHADNGGNDNG